MMSLFAGRNFLWVPALLSLLEPKMKSVQQYNEGRKRGIPGTRHLLSIDHECNMYSLYWTSPGKPFLKDLSSHVKCMICANTTKMTSKGFESQWWANPGASWLWIWTKHGWCCAFSRCHASNEEESHIVTCPITDAWKKRACIMSAYLHSICELYDK